MRTALNAMNFGNMDMLTSVCIPNGCSMSTYSSKLQELAYNNMCGTYFAGIPCSIVIECGAARAVAVMLDTAAVLTKLGFGVARFRACCCGWSPEYSVISTCVW